MKRLKLLLLAIVVLSAPVHGRSVYHFTDSVVQDNQFGTESSIEFEGESPARLYLFPLKKYLDLTGILSSELTDGGTWIETYATAAKSVTVAFEKSLDRGISAIELRKKSNRIRFEPNDGETVSVTKVPPLFIGQVLFANENRRGRKINDYGSRIERDDVVYLAWKIAYRTLTPDIPVTLDIRITDAQGTLMRDAQSPEDCTCRAEFRTCPERAAETEQYLGRLKARFEKGCRLEIVCGGEKLVSISVPARGRMKYVPITDAVGKVWQPRWLLALSEQQRQEKLKELYLKNYTGRISEDSSVNIIGWKVVDPE